MCGVVVIELQKMVCRIGVSLSTVVVASWSWVFKTLRRTFWQGEPRLEMLLCADAYLYQMCHVWRKAPRAACYISSYM